MGPKQRRAADLASRLDLDAASARACPACLSFASLPLGRGDGRAAERGVTTAAPMLWDEGLALPVRAALERACRAGVPDAAEAVDDLTRRGHRSLFFRAVVLRLAAEQAAELEGACAARGNGSDVLPFRPPGRAGPGDG